MPEIKNTFISGKMNKDLDERLVPSGEYRDALNIDIATSEGSNVGVAETSYGNTVVSTIAPSGSTCVGSVSYGREDKIYWLVAGPVPSTGQQGLDLIAEYDLVGGTDTPRAIFVDIYQDIATVSSHTGGQNTITLSSGNANIRAGMTISGTNVPADTTVASISGTTLTLSGVGGDYSSGISGTLTFVADKTLNFDKDVHITGINVLDGFLMWTDDVTEPKKIHIKRCKNGTSSNVLHTKHIIDGIDNGHIEEEDITVIKRYPLTAPKLQLSNTEDGGNANSVTTTAAQFFTYLDSVGGLVTPVPSGTNVDTAIEDADGNIYYDYTSGSAVEVKLPSAITFSPSPGWVVGQTVKLTADAEVNEIDEEVEVRLKLEEQTGFNATSRTFKCSVVSISSEVNDSSNEMVWDCELEQKDPFYELKFPRFAYRWKYKDGEYSVISPWTPVAFLADETNGFDYEAENGYNLAMTNNVRKITINNFETKPDDVVEVDVLYKDSVSTNMYVVETLKDNETELPITSEIVHSLIPSNQSLRPWDNVPRKAKAQEVAGNRLMYGNYLHQYNIPIDPEFDVVHTTIDITPGKPVKSLKSIRNYQVGVVYLDKYGRQTPVLSNDEATLKIQQKDAVKSNRVKVKITNDPPDWATHFKYYIKEPSDQYYNLAMDRWYNAEDGNIWVSFPSSERNKLTIDDYLILKKKHDSSGAVIITGSAKYKILAIENEAPEFLKLQKTSIGIVSTNFGQGNDWTDGVPEKDYTTVVISGRDMDNTSLERIASETVGNKFFRIKTTSGNTSDWYPVGTISRTDHNDDDDYKDPKDYYTVTSQVPFKSDVNFVITDSAQLSSSDEADGKAGGLQFEYAIEETVNEPEFGGRFFVKINKDSILEEYVLSDDANVDYKVAHAVNLYYFTSATNSRSDFRGQEVFGIDDGAPGKHSRPQNGHGNSGGVGFTRGSKYIDIRLIEINKDKTRNPIWYWPGLSQFKSSIGGTKTTNFAVHNALRTNNTRIRFKDDPDQTVYKIRNSIMYHMNNYERGFPYNNSYTGNAFKPSSNHAIRYEIELGRNLKWNPSKAGEFDGVTPSDPNIKDENGVNQYPLTRWNNTGNTRKSYTELQIVVPTNDGISYASSNPAIFETEPKERPDLNLYYETGKTHPISGLGTYQTLDWFNCYSFGNGVESNRIRDDYNAPTIDKGPRVSTELAEQYKEDRKFSGLIYSGIYNSQSDVNETNQFIQAEKITKDLNPAYGSIQKLFTRQTNLLAFCEDKVAKILTNKDALYNADGSTNLTATSKVLAQTIIPDTFGKYGISTNPESFATYGYRIYFTDKNRNTVCRLSGDGIEEISRYGMTDYFKDAFNNNTTGSHILGTYDEDKGNYNLTLNDDTISFTELVRGWTSRKSFIPEEGLSLNGKYYTFKDGEMWEHNKNATRTDFYEADPNPGSSIKLIFNDGPSQVKNFKTLNYEGTQSKILEHDGHDSDGGVGYGAQYYNEDAKNGWYCDSITTDQQSGSVNEFIEKEGKWFNYIKGSEFPKSGTSIDVQEFTSQGIGSIKTNGVGGSTSISTYDIIVRVLDSGSNHYTITAVSGSGITAEGSIITIENKTSGTSINQACSFYLNVKSGYEFTETNVAAMSASEASAPNNSCVVDGNVTFGYVSPKLVLVTVPVIFTTAAQGQTVTMNLSGGAGLPEYSISGTNKVSAYKTTQTTVHSSQATNYSKTNIATTTGVTLFTKQFVSVSSYRIGSDPSEVVNLNGCTNPSNYEISWVENTGTWAAGTLTDVTFTVKYKFPEENIENDVIGWHVQKQENIALSTGKIYDYKFSETSLNHFGELRTIAIYGDPNATLTLNAYNNATSGTSLISGPKTVTMSASGNYKEQISFPANSGSATAVYKVVLTEIDSDSFQFNSGNSPKTITLNQYQEGQITFSVSKSSTTNLTLPTNTVILTGRGNADPRDDDDYTAPEPTWIVVGNSSKKWRTPVKPTASHITGASVSGDVATLTNGGKITPDLDVTVDNTIGVNNTATITGSYDVSLLGTDDDTAVLNLDNIIALNVAPVSNALAVNVDYETARTFNLSASDTEGDTLTYSTVGSPSSGSLSALNTATGAITYTPNGSFSGGDTFTYKVNDTYEDSNTATVTLTVAGSGGSSVARYEIEIYNASGYLTGVHYIDATQVCDSGSLTSSVCLGWGSLTNKWFRYVTVAGGCGSTVYGRAKLKGAVSAGVPTAYISENTYFNNSDDSYNNANGTSC